MTTHLCINAMPIKPGGGLTVLLGLIEAWRTIGSKLHITVVASEKDTLNAVADTKCADRVEAINVAGARKQFLWENSLFGAQLAAFKPDVLMTNNYYVHNVSFPQIVHHQDLWRFVTPGQVGVTRSVPGEMVRKWAANKALRSAAANVFVSEYIRREAERVFPDSAPRNHVIYNGLSEQALRRAEEIDQRYTGEPRLMAIQSANRHKDTPTLLRTLAFLVYKAPEVNWRLDVAGGHGRGSWEPFQQLAVELGIDDRVTWRGYCSQDQLDELLRRSLCLVFTSILESFGLPPLEAMARRCPTIAAKTTAIPEIVGEAGILVEPRNPDQFADAVLELYHSPRLRDEYVQRGRERIRRFNWNESAAKFAEIFERYAA
ncbi:MAG: glycosyltransferase family 4 protein [Pirellulales bacterium]|nr:glycosyltransferase family 4 protein [Pirellulales bacterium]